MKRRSLLLASGLLPVLSGAPGVRAQASLPLVGVLRTGSPDGDFFTGVFRRDMARLGFEEGRNYRTQYVFADGARERLPALAADLVKAGAQVLVVFSVSGVAAAQAATRTVPIVALADDLSLLETGQVASVARPGGNTTGVSMLGRQLDGKRLEVLHELAPGARKIGFVSDGTQAVRDELPKFEAAARRLGLSPSVLQVETVDAIAPGMASFAASGVDAVQFLASTFLQAARARCVAEATRLGLPAIYEWPETVEEGGLSSYGPRLTLCFRHIAVLVSKVLKGARPADLPIEQPTIYTLAINVGAARRIGFAVPEHMLLRADLLVD